MKTKFKPLPLARPSTDARDLLYSISTTDFSQKGRGGRDGKLRVWDAGAQQWMDEDKTPLFSVRVGKARALVKFT